MEMETDPKKLDITNNIIGILKHYECPKECGAYCCKRERVYISKKDYTDISKLHRTNIKHISITDDFEKGDYFLNYPCGLLVNDKCSVHKNKPWTCSIYPFKFADNVPHMHVALQACPMSLKIALDWTVFSTWVNINSNMSENDKKNSFDIMTINIKTFEKDIKNFKTSKRIKEIYIPVNMLHTFRCILDDANR